MNWLILILAGIFEIVFTISLKFSENFKVIKWNIVLLISIFMSVYLLNKAIQSIPIGVAYSVWTGIGVVGTVLFGIVLFKEPYNFWHLLFIFTIIASIVGLKLLN